MSYKKGFGEPMDFVVFMGLLKQVAIFFNILSSSSIQKQSL